MYIKDKRASLVYKLALAVLCGVGLYLNSGLTEGAFNIHMFSFFTILSNYMVFIYTVLGVIRCARSIHRNGPQGTCTLMPRFKGAFSIAILTTFIIYQFLLVPQQFSMAGGERQAFRWGNALVHHIVPIMMLADWALFDPKGRFRVYDPILWCVVPLSYLVFVLLRARVGGILPHVGSRYPYFFIDIDTLGGWQVFINVLLFAVYYLIQGYMLLLIDRGLGAVGRKKDAEQDQLTDSSKR